jgi:hypothetical protein
MRRIAAVVIIAIATGLQQPLMERSQKETFCLGSTQVTSDGITVYTLRP